MGSLFLLALLSCVPRTPPEPAAAAASDSEADTSGRIGMRFLALAEGLLVEGVQTGLGAADAGIVPGDVVVAVGGQQAAGSSAGALREAIIGPPGTAVSMTLQAPLSGALRTVEVERRAPPASAPQERATGRRATPKPIREFTAAARRASPEEVAAAAQALIDADLGEQSLGEAARGGLRLAAKEQPDNARAAMAVLDEAGEDDWFYQHARSEALQILGEHRAAADAMARAQALRPADHRTTSGDRADLGGDPKGRKIFIESAWESGQEQAAIDAARALLRTGYSSTTLQARLGMAALAQGEAWTAPLPPLDDFSTELLDGSPWTLSEHEGEVVVMAFWASWCGPCRKEMPELEALWQARGSEGATFLAVSIDDPSDRDKVGPKLEEFGVTFPATHRPDLGGTFNVTGIPAIRVLNRRGALHYAAKGYSPTSVEQLDEQLDVALSQESDETLLGEAWSDAGARLAHFLPLPGAQGIWSDGVHTVVGVDGTSPLVLSGPLPDRVETTLDGADPQTTDRLAWLGGPVAATERGRIVRAWDEDGTARWLRTTPAPVVDLAAGGGLLWIATRGGLHALDTDGALVTSSEHALSALASAEGGVWGVGEGRLWWLSAGVPPEDRGAAPDGMQVDGLGGVSTGIATDLVVGRFGPAGEHRPVAVRTDNTIIGADGDGAPGFTWALSQPARIAAGDLDGDGRDELLVSLSRQGVAVVELTLP
ncbi:MAG: thiol-disulfide isomerase/thioredoxin [Myxococcota bacterium]|jgi:thiol-disulfide isomerase/thioredoxin